jgi:hypothetical protein
MCADYSEVAPGLEEEKTNPRFESEPISITAGRLIDEE